MTTLISTILDTCHSINNNRDVKDVFTSLVEEVGELSTEIAISSGHKKREASNDGIVGESIDVIIAVTDILYLEMKKYGMTSDDIESAMIKRAENKLKKWENEVKNK